MRITYYGHSCFQVDTGSHKLLFDPFITPNEKASDIEISSIEADFILLSHGHEDHIADVMKIYERTKATVISTYEVVHYFQDKGVENAQPMNHGGSWKFDFGKVKMVSAIHSSSFPDGSYAGNPAGFVVQTKAGTFYYAGDTALTMDMKLIAEQFKINFAFMPIGDNFTMDINDAVKAADFVNTDKIIGMHYDTFPYIEIDHDQAKNVAANSKKDLTLMQIGESITI